MSPGAHLVAFAIAVALLPPQRGAAAETDLALDAELGSGLDSNPERALRGAGPSDGFVSALVRGSWRTTGDRFAASARLAEAVRLYATTDATAAGSRLDAAAQWAVSDAVTLGGALLASDLTERGHRLDQDVLDAVGSVAWARAGWRVHAGAGWSLFSPRDAPLQPFLSSGPRAAAGIAWEVVAGETLAASYDLALSGYPRWRDFAGTSRDDRTHTVGVELAHRGAFLAAAGYAYTWNRSTAPGGAFDRHRVHARVAADLPADLTLAARAMLQWSSYPQPLFLAQQLLLSEGQQNLDALEVRLTRPLSGALELVVSVALYRAEAAVAPGDVPSFTRAVGSLGIAWRGQWSSMTGTPYGPDGR